MEYISAAQAAEKWGISIKRVQLLCREERIDGVKRLGKVYLIPDDSEKPKDERVKSGKYIKK